VGLIVYLIILFFIGLFVGALARLLLPGPDPRGIGMTALVGLCGCAQAAASSASARSQFQSGSVLDPSRWMK
jgi:uncharacterized membrane protein YeaQ/YmgE (transglycosylase-associated protein family)